MDRQLKSDREIAGIDTRDFKALREAILEQRQHLPKRLAQIAAYALDNPDEVAFGTVASIAASVGVQPSTLIRFAQYFGYDGFTSLQSVFRERLRERNSSYDERLNVLRGGEGGSRSLRILEGFAATSEQSLTALLRRADDATLDNAIAALARAETIYILARRRSYPVASYLAYGLGKLQIRYQLVDSTAGLDPELLGFAGPRDAAIVVSFSPYAPATLQHAQTLAQSDVPIVAITDSAFSPLSQVADHLFEVAEADFAGFRSLAATMALSMTLAVSVAELRRNTGSRKR